MNFREALRLPTGTLISGTIRVPCQSFGCESIITVEIEDVDKEGHGGEVDSIDDQLEELDWRCEDCREAYRKECAEYERLNACGNAVAAKRFSISNPRERQLAFTALFAGA